MRRRDQEVALPTDYDPAHTSRCKRPLVGEAISPGIFWSKDCFAPMTDAELRDWGL